MNKAEHLVFIGELREPVDMVSLIVDEFGCIPSSSVLQLEFH